ncbi:MAG TPA: hypothetical protein PLP33_27850 [Leptospiraceae bacterium]|nr:hypothetical protein [Leptospiraceae bacterium]
MAGYGYKEIQRVGNGIQVLVHDKDTNWKVGGVTIHWGAVSAETADPYREVRPYGETVNTNFLSSNSPADDFVYKDEKFIRYGTVLCRISGGTVDGYFAPYGSTSIGGGTLLKTRGDMFVSNVSIHEGDTASDYGFGVFEGGTVWKYRLAANFNLVQNIAISATGGTFTVTYKGQTTSALAYNASASTVQTALQGLSTIGSGNATVTLNGSTYTVTLANSLYPHAAFTTNAASLTGGSQTATVSNATDTTAGPTQAELDLAFPNIRYVNETN